ncbi:MAG: DUF3179 domain-containing (seleno)protein, partial [Candidatus Heimdallarchaeota archaeon]
VIADSFRSLSEVSSDYEKFLENDPELVVIHTNVNDERFKEIKLPEQAHIVPLRNLIAGDMILSINPNRKYSLTYCLLCNSIHAYLLPIIRGKEVFISSNQGSVLNGNKVLTDKRGTYIWQQFNGKLIHNSTNTRVDDLIEIRNSRVIWLHAKELYKDGLFYHRKVKFSIYIFFKLFGKLVKRFDNLAFSRGGANKELQKKIPIIGVSVIGEGEKAYPYDAFKPGEISIFEDTIGSTEFTFIFNGLGAYVYKATGLTLENNKLTKEVKSWSLNGVAIGDHENLIPLHITEHAYWYLWNKFYPNTEIYNRS